MMESKLSKPYFFTALFFGMLFFWLSLFGVIDITRAWTNPSGNPPVGTGSGLTGTGTSGNVSKYTSSNNLGNSGIYEDGSGNVGVGTTVPGGKLDVVGTVKATGFNVPTGAGVGKVLTSDASGIGTWQTPVVGLSGGGTVNYVGKFTGTGTVGNSQIFDDGTNVGIGTGAPGYKLDVPGYINTSAGGAYGTGGLRFGYHTLSSNSNSWLYVGDQNGAVYGGRGIAAGNLYIDGAATLNGTVSAGGNITSPKFRISNPINNISGPLGTANYSFTTGGGTLVLFVSGSGYRTSCGLGGVSLNASTFSFSPAMKLYFCPANTHTSLVSHPLIVSGVAAGSYLMNLTGWNGSSGDVSDFYNVTILELPF